MKIIVLQHSAGDTPGAAGEALTKLGHTLEIVRTNETDADPVPTTVDGDALLLFGGPISLSGRDHPLWVEQECELIRKYTDAGRRIMGFCLGSQLIASALGARVKRNANAEVGWHLTQRVHGPESKIADAFPFQFTAFHWHGDTWELPPRATHILQSDGCAHQGFVIEDRICGFQCHLEANERTVEIFMAASNMHRNPERFVQTEQQIREGIQLHLANQNEILGNLINAWLS